MAELVSDVWVQGRWYGPSYPRNGNPPSGSVTNPAAFGDYTPGDYEANPELDPADQRPAAGGSPIGTGSESHNATEASGSERKQGRSRS